MKKSVEEYLKENNKLADFERAVVLNDLQSIYSIVEDLVDSEVKNCSTPDFNDSFDSLIDRLERALNKKYPTKRQWSFSQEEVKQWEGKEDELLKRVKKLEKELYYH